MLYLDCFSNEDPLTPPYTISGKDFSDFLDICLKNSDCFSLSVARWYGMTRTELFLKLKPYLLLTASTPKWYGYDYTDTMMHYREITVHLFKSCPEARDIIMEYFHDIFLNPGDYDPCSDSAQNLEDLNFFKDGRNFVQTISHESLLFIHSHDEEFLNSIRRFGEWCEDEDTPEDELYLKNMLPSIKLPPITRDKKE